MPTLWAGSRSIPLLQGAPYALLRVRSDGWPAPGGVSPAPRTNPGRHRARRTVGGASAADELAPAAQPKAERFGRARAVRRRSAGRWGVAGDMPYPWARRRVSGVPHIFHRPQSRTARREWLAHCKSNRRNIAHAPRAQSGPSTRRLGARARARAPGPLVPERSRAAHPPRATSLPAHRTVNFTANTHTATTPEKPRTPLGHLPAAAAPLRHEHRRHLGLEAPHSLLHRVGVSDTTHKQTDRPPGAAPAAPCGGRLPGIEQRRARS